MNNREKLAQLNTGGDMVEPRPELRRQLTGLTRYIATSETAKHRVLYVVTHQRCARTQARSSFARDDDTTFGILSSRFHDRMGASD